MISVVPATVDDNPGEVALLAGTPSFGPAIDHKLVPVVDAIDHKLILEVNAVLRGSPLQLFRGIPPLPPECNRSEFYNSKKNQRPRRRLHEYVFSQKRILFSPVYTKTMKTFTQNGDF